MTFQKGHKKHPDAGIKKGQQQRKTVIRRELIDAFEAHGLCLGEEIAKATVANDHERVDTLLKIAPYLWAKYGPRTAPGEQAGAVTLAAFLERVVAQPQDVLPAAEKKAEGEEP